MPRALLDLKVQQVPPALPARRVRLEKMVKTEPMARTVLKVPQVRLARKGFRASKVFKGTQGQQAPRDLPEPQGQLALPVQPGNR